MPAAASARFSRKKRKRARKETREARCCGPQARLTPAPGGPHRWLAAAQRLAIAAPSRSCCWRCCRLQAGGRADRHQHGKGERWGKGSRHPGQMAACKLPVGSGDTSRPPAAHQLLTWVDVGHKLRGRLAAQGIPVDARKERVGLELRQVSSPCGTAWHSAVRVDWGEGKGGEISGRQAGAARNAATARGSQPASQPAALLASTLMGRG